MMLYKFRARSATMAAHFKHLSRLFAGFASAARSQARSHSKTAGEENLMGNELKTEREVETAGGTRTAI